MTDAECNHDGPCGMGIFNEGQLTMLAEAFAAGFVGDPQEDIERYMDEAERFLDWALDIVIGAGFLENAMRGHMYARWDPEKGESGEWTFGLTPSGAEVTKELAAFMLAAKAGEQTTSEVVTKLGLNPAGDQRFA